MVPDLRFVNLQTSQDGCLLQLWLLKKGWARTGGSEVSELVVLDRHCRGAHASAACVVGVARYDENATVYRVWSAPARTSFE